MGLQGVIRGKPVKTTISDEAAPCPLDHVSRQFQAPRPNALWGADFTYVATWAGFLRSPNVYSSMKLTRPKSSRSEFCNGVAVSSSFCFWASACLRVFAMTFDGL